MSRPVRAPRNTLSRDRVVAAAVELADESGLEALTIRALAARAEVKPMAIYHHVPSKDAILDGIVDAVFAETTLPVPGRPWRPEIERRSRSVRDAVLRHPWAAGLLDSRRTPGPATLAAHDAVIGTFRLDGFSADLTAHAFALVDSFVYGFVLQETTMPVGSPEDVPAVAHEILGGLDPARYPHLVAFTHEHVLRPGYDFADEFERGLDAVLDALERALAAA